jgi:hypothetical protein
MNDSRKSEVIRIHVDKALYAIEMLITAASEIELIVQPVTDTQAQALDQMTEHLAACKMMILAIAIAQREREHPREGNVISIQTARRVLQHQ